MNVPDSGYYMYLGYGVAFGLLFGYAILLWWEFRRGRHSNDSRES